MKKLFLILFVVTTAFALPTCKKAVDQKAEDYIIKVMTEGRWYMHEFSEAGLDITYEFNGIEFQFYADGRVDAIQNSTVKSGTWQGDIANFAIISNFPNATLPLSRLNYTWKITDSYTNAVYAETTASGVLYKMLLVKK